MQHSIEDLLRRLEVMKDKAILLHRVRNEFSEISYKDYDKVALSKYYRRYTSNGIGHCE